MKKFFGIIAIVSLVAISFALTFSNVGLVRDKVALQIEIRELSKKITLQSMELAELSDELAARSEALATEQKSIAMLQRKYDIVLKGFRASQQQYATATKELTAAEKRLERALIPQETVGSAMYDNLYVPTREAAHKAKEYIVNIGE